MVASALQADADCFENVLENNDFSDILIKVPNWSKTIARLNKKNWDESAWKLCVVFRELAMNWASELNPPHNYQLCRAVYKLAFNEWLQ